MSFTPQSSPPKRPRLSLQIKTPATAVTFGKSSTALKVDVDPASPTAFNTLSNAYATAIENASPRTAKPMSANIKSLKPTSLRLETKNFNSDGYVHPSRRTNTPGLFTITYPDTPSSALPGSTPISGPAEAKQLSATAATAFTFTPPQSAGTTDQSQSRIFTFDANVSNKANPSILRNSPLPPRSTITPATPTRASLRLANKAAKKVGYNDPLTQTITTNKYIKSHIELLAEDSPFSATIPEAESIDAALAYANDTRDGGQTPGPFEEMRRRMAESELETPGARKRRRKEKKRKWEWTITNTEAEGAEGKDTDKTPMTAVNIADTPITTTCREASVSTDSEVSEVEGRYVPSVDPSTDSEMSDSDQRPGTSHSL
ncbi:hypothetical protein G7Y89_g7743 [Cudoniella acicularis]|uniref:Uncharacterized protein n=1 Tax=Cudoniella acicularis TaxID=354080 RepID=A0A8H4RJX0_9HELO|nr:hypothetical protein G7Y89_g7743 [Cudoniella acicularis]